MKKILKWVGIALGSILILLAGTAFFMQNNFSNRLKKHYSISPESIVLPTDSVSIARGKQLAQSICTQCHGEDLGGTNFFNEPSLGVINSTNLSPGNGGVGAVYTDADWVRAIRHGIRKDGTPLFIMPSKEFHHFSQENLGQIIAYLKTLPPVDKKWDAPKLTFLARILAQNGAFGDVINAETIDHSQSFNSAPERAATPVYGEYLVSVAGCRTCHGPKLNGGKDPDPTAPFAPNLTPGGNLPEWGADGFTRVMKTGITPMGKELNGKYMPWKGFSHLDTTDIHAVYQYLMSQPKLETTVLE